MRDTMKECQSDELIWEALTASPPYHSPEVVHDSQPLGTRTCEYYELLKCRPTGHHYFISFSSPHEQYSLLAGADWQILRRLGFGIWSTRRLFELGLQDPAHAAAPLRGTLSPKPIRTSVMTPNDVMFTWKALYDAAVADVMEPMGERERIVTRSTYLIPPAS